MGAKITCRRHGGTFLPECPTCKKERIMAACHAITVARETDQPEAEIRIKWENPVGDEWEAYRWLNYNTQWARIPAMDSENLFGVMKFMRDFLDFRIDEDYFTPGEIPSI